MFLLGKDYRRKTTNLSVLLKLCFLRHGQKTTFHASDSTFSRVVNEKKIAVLKTGFYKVPFKYN